MEVIKFNLSGRFAFFKKPDVNTYMYFTYGNIHKVALLGMLGGISGYKGYSQMSFESKYKKAFKGLNGKKDRPYPEFYERLKHLRVGIVPKSPSLNKKVQVFNNSVGYASKEQGGNLIVKEQWLENPSWDIYIVIEDDEGRKLSKTLMDQSFVYIPYLGKNDHFADIKDIELISQVEEISLFDRIDSLFIKDDFKIVENEDLDELEEDIPVFKYEEMLPASLDETTNKYGFTSYIYTNMNVRKTGSVPIYAIGNKNIVFI